MTAHKERHVEGWVTFDKLCEAWGKMPFEILGFMKIGLSACSPLGRRVTNPPKEYNGLRYIEKSLRSEAAKRIFWDYRGKLKDSPFPTEPFEDFDFNLPIDKQNAESVLAQIRTFVFKIKDVNEFAKVNKLPLVSVINTEYENEELESKVRKENQQQTVNQINQSDSNDFISNLKVEYSSDTSIIVTQKGKQSKEYSCQEMGFKATTKTWRMFIGILQNDDPKYHVGIHPKDKNGDKIKQYNRTMKIIKACEKKFVNFLNHEYSAQIPGNSRVFRNMKGIDRDGTYRPIFQVVRPAAEREEITKEMSKEQWQKGMDILAEKKRHEKDPNKEARILAQMGPYITKGNREGWLSRIQAEKYLTPNDENSAGDLLVDAGPLPNNI